MLKALNLKPVRVRKLSPKVYLRLGKAEKSNISKIRFIQPKIGDHNFGHFEVTYKRPVYHYANE